MPKPSVSNPAEFILSSFLKTFAMPGQPGQKPGRIAFLADFQCGKSTFFNLLCGGLEVSPRGNGVRTSSTIVEASDAPPEEAGAEIVWKPDVDLAQIVDRAFPGDGPKSGHRPVGDGGGAGARRYPWDDICSGLRGVAALRALSR